MRICIQIIYIKKLHRLVARLSKIKVELMMIKIEFTIK